MTAFQPITCSFPSKLVYVILYSNQAKGECISGCIIGRSTQIPQYILETNGVAFAWLLWRSGEWDLSTVADCICCFLVWPNVQTRRWKQYARPKQRVPSEWRSSTTEEAVLFNFRHSCRWHKLYSQYSYSIRSFNYVEKLNNYINIAFEAKRSFLSYLQLCWKHFPRGKNWHLL
jgi:hypothetical protein